MSRDAQRPGIAVRVLLATGALALSAAACASQGTVVAAGSVPTSGATGSVSAPASVTSSGSPSTSQTSVSDSQSSSSDAASSSSSAPSAPDSSPEFHGPAANHKVTDVVTEGGYRLKIHSVTLPYVPPAGASFEVPPTKAFLLLDFEAANVSDQPLMFSTLGAFDLRDSGNIGYLVSIAATDDLPKAKQFQDREMKPGETASGQLVFMVDEHAKGLTLTFRGNVWHAGQNRPVIDLGH